MPTVYDKEADNLAIYCNVKLLNKSGIFIVMYKDFVIVFERMNH